MRQRERASTSEQAQTGEGQRERETEREGERIPSRLCTISTEPGAGLELMDHEIVT